MSGCNPKTCDDLGERMAIMSIDGRVSVSLETQSIKTQCETCDRRGSHRLMQILQSIRG